MDARACFNKIEDVGSLVVYVRKGVERLPEAGADTDLLADLALCPRAAPGAKHQHTDSKESPHAAFLSRSASRRIARATPACLAVASFCSGIRLIPLTLMRSAHGSDCRSPQTQRWTWQPRSLIALEVLADVR